MSHSVRARLRDITKSFGSFRALDGIDFDIREGEVHALVGENGAGKSTLMRVLAGQLDADAGSVEIDGRPPTARAARTVGFVEQEGGLVDELTGAENLILGEQRAVLAGRRAASKRLQDEATRLGLSVRPGLVVSRLPIGERQRLEILVALAAGARVLVLDEPTASLGAEDANILADLIRTFTDGGGSVVYISHKLREVLAVADRITVLRRGVVTGHYDHVAGLTVAQLADDMIGTIGGVAERILLGEAHRSDALAGDVVCELDRAELDPGRDVHVERMRSVSFIVRAGEIVGIAGVVGSGQTTFAEILTGLRKPTSGSVHRSSAEVGYVPEHRREHAIAPAMSLARNLIIHVHRTLGRGPLLSRRMVDAYAVGIVAAFRVRTPGLNVPISALSGGNQQRAVVGRELDRSPRLVVAHNPFRGLDVGAIADVETALIDAARAGAGVIVISSDLEEIMPISTRIAVLFDGALIGEVDPTDADASERLGALMGGAR